MQFEPTNKRNAAQDPAAPLFLNDSLSLQFAADVRMGLGGTGQKKLPPKYFYDDLGSTLFEAITFLPEYGLTRADARLLQQHAVDLLRLSRWPSVIAELGSGAGSKTRFVLEAVREPKDVTYCPIDISTSALTKCELELQRTTHVEIHRIEDSYLNGLVRATRLRHEESPMLVLFLGSTIGNFDADEALQFCRSVRERLKLGDVFLLSTDLEKSVARTIAAYDDALGVTAAFNLNLLARINRELGGNFDLSQFRHVASYNSDYRRIEMHLRSVSNQTVRLDRNFVVTFREGETIWTESSYKFRPEDIVALAESAGFHCEAQWVDKEWPFAQSVLRAI
jgi:dimethylhistidine N-methyltransferase